MLLCAVLKPTSKIRQFPLGSSCKFLLEFFNSNSHSGSVAKAFCCVQGQWFDTGTSGCLSDEVGKRKSPCVNILAHVTDLLVV